MSAPALTGQPPVIRDAARMRAQLGAAADWIEYELAGGEPAKWVAHVAADAFRYLAAQVDDDE